MLVRHRIDRELFGDLREADLRAYTECGDTGHPRVTQARARPLAAFVEGRTNKAMRGAPHQVNFRETALR